MDDFNNFFDDQRTGGSSRTPIYHTPEPKRGGKNLVAIICIIVAAIMCVVVVINVIVLASLKNTIATKFADSMATTMRSEYADAIKDALSETNVIEDVTSSATQQVTNAIQTTVGSVAESHVSSVCRLYMFTNSDSTSTSQANGIATGFLITDTDAYGSGRYIVTNAHCVRYEAAQRVGGGFFGSYTYTWKSFAKIICAFEGESSFYNTEIISYGAYASDHLACENNQADLAILRIVGNQPSNSAHPSLKIRSVTSASEEVKRGTPVALIGNPQGISGTGETDSGESASPSSSMEQNLYNSITSGTVTLTGISFSGENGLFIMTDAAINGGNSGGPMLDMLGTVVGVVESKFTASSVEAMGFAISARTLQEFIEWSKLASHNLKGKNLAINCSYLTV